MVTTMAAKEVEQIERIHGISTEEFIRCHLNPARPVIIENYARDWPAMSWTWESLQEKVGENTVHVRRNTGQEEYKVGKKYNVVQSKFSEYLDDLLEGNKRSKNSYLAVQNLKQAFPELLHDVIVPDFVGKLHGGPYMWVATKDHYEFCHFDPDDNILAMISGRKRVRLYGCDLKTMYPNMLGSKGRTIQSQVNCDEPDLKMFGNFAQASCYECILEPGDMLYFPAFWWHQVTSLDLSISVNMFFGNAGENNFLTKIMRPPQSDAFHYWLLNIIEQNRCLESFQRILANLADTLFHFLLNQFHEHASSEQIEELVELVMTHCNLESLPMCMRTANNPPKLKIRGLLWRS